MARFVFLAVFTVTIGSVSATAQGLPEPLFDTFNFKLEGSWVRTATTIRLDSQRLGEGTTLSFEDDLGLPDDEVVPSASFEWQFARRHRLGVRWQDVMRDSTTQVLEEIEWGGEVIPIDANVALGFDIRTLSADYTYYPWIEERWAGGFGLGFRVMGLKTTLTVDETKLESQVDGTAPLPYVNFEYRRILGAHWRVKVQLGWLDVNIGDIDGGQQIARLAGEYITDRRWGFGAAFNYSNIDVDWDNIDNPIEANALRAVVDLDINDFSLYLRVRW